MAEDGADSPTQQPAPGVENPTQQPAQPAGESSPAKPESNQQQSVTVAQEIPSTPEASVITETGSGGQTLVIDKYGSITGPTKGEEPEETMIRARKNAADPGTDR